MTGVTEHARKHTHTGHIKRNSRKESGESWLGSEFIEVPIITTLDNVKPLQVEKGLIVTDTVPLKTELRQDWLHKCTDSAVTVDPHHRGALCLLSHFE